ncbi:MAG TPA: cobalamin-dependent protein, partial [Gemmatimonadaceae bacterium]|nr:cobalamin-dependent protein [Gemmatimonadaceae bacterium]
MRVYLADLGHNLQTFSSDIYPIGVANLAAYTTAYLQSRTPVELKIFREPQDLRAALESAPPTVLALSSYAWNHELAKSFARFAKRRDPGVITMMGGPNYPLTLPEMESHLRSMPEIDLAVRGPTYEGERAFLAIMQRLVAVNGARAGLLEEMVPGNDWIDPKTGAFVRGASLPRITDLDEIPSPYVMGWMDPFYTSGYFPMLQIARGCPFTCQFCNSSVKENSKVFAHSVENVCRDLLHVAERVRPELPVCFADDNFGMYERDQEIAEYIAYLQDRFGWPRYIRTTTGKNRADRVIKVMRTVRGTLPMTSAVQSLNPEVLENIKRSNISLDAYAEIQKEVQAQGMQAYGELILSMPGETKASFMQSVSDLLDSGVKRVSAHQLMLLHGAPLSNPDQRARFGFKTKWRVVARNLGNYGTGEDLVEVEEMVVETPTFSYAEYFE